MTYINNLGPYSIVALISLLSVLTIVIYIFLFYRSKFENTNDVNWLTPPEHFCQINSSTQIAYRQYGKGRDLLFIHGIGANTYCWRLLYSYFDLNKYRLTFIDLPGFGYSTKSNTLSYSLDEQCQNILRLTEKLELKNVCTIGSSMGGAIALMLSLKHPNIYQKTVAIAPAAGVKLIPKVLRKIQSVSYYLNWGLNKKTMTIILKSIFVNKNLVNPATIEGYLKPYLDNKTDSLHAFVRSGHLIMDKRLPHCFKDIQSSPLILSSKRDIMVRKSHTKKTLSYIPQAIHFLHPKAGHHIMEDSPEWVHQHIITYLEKSFT